MACCGPGLGDKREKISGWCGPGMSNNNAPLLLPYRLVFFDALMYKMHPKIWSYFLVPRFIKNTVNSYSCIRGTPPLKFNFGPEKCVLYTRWYGTLTTERIFLQASVRRAWRFDELSTFERKVHNPQSRIFRVLPSFDCLLRHEMCRTV